MPTRVSYARPRTVAQTLDLLSGAPGEARPLAGGTDLLVGLRDGRLRPRVLVDLKRLDDLRPGITVHDGVVGVSAPTTMTQLAGHEVARAHFPALVEAANVVGSIQIRDRATLAGNICNASPAADTAPALLAYQASVVTASKQGERRLMLREFLLGPRVTALRPEEIVTALEIPVPEPGTAAAFARLTRRRGVDLATVSVCCAVRPDGEVRFGYGAVGPRPFLAVDRTRTLAEAEAGSPEAERVLAELAARATPISDVRGGREYRQAMVLVLSRRALAAAQTRAGEASE